MKTFLPMEIAMRRLSLLLLAVLPLTAVAQYPAQQQGPALYPYNKNQLPPGAVYDNNPGIPTSGTEQAKQLEANKQRQRSGPTMIHRSYDGKGSTAVITGPDGTTVCRDAYGRRSSTTVCY